MSIKAPKIPSSHEHDRSTWLSLFGGFAIWFLHLNIVYPLTSVACRWGWFNFTVVGLQGIQVVDLAITLIATLLMLITIYLPWRNWRHFQTDYQHMLSQTEGDRRPLMAFVSMMLNGFFFLFVIGSLVPVLMLNPCA